MGRWCDWDGWQTGKSRVMQLVALLAASTCFSRIVLFVRAESTLWHSLPAAHQLKITQTVVDFANQDSLQKTILFEMQQTMVFEMQSTPNAAFNCLGTTYSDAGSEKEFRRIDYEIPLAFARLYKQTASSKSPAMQTSFHLVTSGGADPASYFLYPRTKGELERDITALSFDNLVIYHPGLLLFNEDEQRTGKPRYLEAFAINVARMGWIKSASCTTDQLAKTIVMKAEDGTRRGVEVVANSSIILN